jgi:hypothetical protein
MTQTKFDEAFKGDFVSNILVIFIGDNPKIRMSFEDEFVKLLREAGVNAVTSYSVIPMPPDLKLEKEDILNVAKKYNNDAVSITFLKSLKDKDIITRDKVSVTDFYSFYGFAFGYAGQPTYSNIETTVLMETRLYDIKTEEIMWTGQSKTWNIKSVNEIIHEVTSMVIKDLQEDKLIAVKTN